MKAEFLMLSHQLQPRHCPAGFYVSEKLDGMRAFWDGGLSRGLPALQVPWANCAKHERFKNEVFATGLWTRYAQPIQAPEWFLDALPQSVLLDGELWCGRGKHQQVVSICKTSVGESDWHPVKYVVFDRPSFTYAFRSRSVNNPFIKLEISNTECQAFALGRCDSGNFDKRKLFQHPLDYRDILSNWLGSDYINDTVSNIKQIKLPNGIKESEAEIERLLLEVEALGGEGLMLRRPVSIWEPIRSHNLLKVKKRHDMEVTVIGYNWGRYTDKGSKLLCKMGSAICKMDNGKTFELSGFTDQEREMRCIPGKFEDHNEDGGKTLIKTAGKSFAGKECGDHFEAVNFPRGTRISIRYRELTDDGIPKEASYFRIKQD